MRLTRKTASGWLIRLALTAALLHWEYAAANGTNILLLLILKKKHTQISFFLFLNVYLYTRIMRLFVDFSFFWVCVHVSFRDK